MATEQEWDLSGECGDKPAALTPSQDFKTLYGANVVSLHGTVVRATEQAYASQRVALTRRALRMRTHALMSQPVQRKFPELWLNGHQSCADQRKTLANGISRHHPGVACLVAGG